MNVFAEVEIRSKKGTTHIVDVLRQFSAHSSEWAFDEEKTTSWLADFPNRVGCVVVWKGNDWEPGIGIFEEGKGCCRIVNIVPKQIGTIPTAEYNQIAQQFYDKVKQWSRKNGSGLRLTISKTDLNLEDIVTAKKPLGFFEVFLHNHPLSGHAHDIERLDLFICAVSKYSRKEIDLYYLGQYLEEKEGWSAKDVARCLERIRIGLEIISVYKKF